MADRIVWFEIPVADPDRAQRFYETIFGISMQRLPIGNEFTLILFPAQPNEVQGALAYHPDFYFPGNQGPLIYLNADPSMDLILDRVTQTGCDILIPKRQISEERGFMAVILDSEGNRIALMSKK